MPTYAYACKQCAHRFDAVQSFAEPTLSVCPECGGTLRKEYGSIGVTFNGSGFYRTDSRAGEAKTAGKKGADAASSGGSGTGTGSASPAASASSTSSSPSAPAPSGS
ncbi:FmdB family zinc ribbon protein [Microbacterium lushaniae]|uniref:FmdB family transcriptional regulator n=1 Tax=Microbacterium lushaniae TaxID=2614639 RepID=A0A5J6L5A8_9MICO|nr:FmdB family zinc ribbon protein [Microbacterium lushaniae]QEW03748.1 FmdB family transcriptional regulator [Microbacterium lushaniae]